MEAFDLLIVFTTAGALVGATLVKTLVSSGKGLGLLPDSGRVLLYATLGLSAALVGLALTASPPFLADGFNGQDVLIIVLSVLGVYTSAIGVHETAAKIQRAVTTGTDPSGPDPQ